MRKIKRQVYLVLLIIMAAIMAGYAYLKKTNFFEIDACLDRGGPWDYQTEKCDTAFLPVNLSEY